MSSNARKLISQQATVFRAVENSPELLELLEIATTSPRKIIFIESLLEILPTAFDPHAKKCEDLFIVFNTWFGIYHKSNTTHFAGISAALEHRKKYFLELRHKKRQFIQDIGLDWTAEDKSKYISAVNSLSALVGKSSFLPRLRPYMFHSWKHLILQNTTGSSNQLQLQICGNTILKRPPSLINDINDILFICMTQPNFSSISTLTQVLLFTTRRRTSF